MMSKIKLIINAPDQIKEVSLGAKAATAYLLTVSVLRRMRYSRAGSSIYLILPKKRPWVALIPGYSCNIVVCFARTWYLTS